MSKNLTTGAQEWKKVTASAQTGTTTEYIVIEKEDGSKPIKCTPDHKIYTKNRGYVEAKNLLESDELDELQYI